eukprot:247090-Pelagomonas_calceolata.AAC.1
MFPIKAAALKGFGVSLFVEGKDWTKPCYWKGFPVSGANTSESGLHQNWFRPPGNMCTLAETRQF